VNFFFFSKSEVRGSQTLPTLEAVSQDLPVATSWPSPSGQRLLGCVGEFTKTSG